MTISDSGAKQSWRRGTEETPRRLASFGCLKITILVSERSGVAGNAAQMHTEDGREQVGQLLLMQEYVWILKLSQHFLKYLILNSLKLFGMRRH